MRPILAFAILLVGLRAAAPETKYQDSLPAIGANPSPASYELAAPIGKSDRDFFVAIPALESADAAHDQGEAAAEPPQALAPSSIDADSDDDVADSIDELCNAMMTSARDNGLPVAFFANLIWQESGLRNDAVSPVGALGIAQFMPDVATEVGLDNPFDPRQAIPASARLLHALREHFGNLGFVAAAYNAGAHRVGEWLDHRRALPLQTRTYVLRVTGHTVEAWRKAPVDDAELTFVQPLPCRGLPAFAELEQAQLREARQLEQARRAQAHLREQKPAAQVAAKRPELPARKTEKKAPIAHRLAAERRATGIIARNFHGGGHEAAHRQHAPHEKRRVA